jgi:roadblock/LC7 domain-containing protein
MIRRLLALDGVMVVARFRDDGQFVEGYGLLDDRNMSRLARFAHDYKRFTQGNADQFSLFTQLRGWTPPKGWIVRGHAHSVCSIGNLVCLVNNAEGSVNEIMRELDDAAHF